MSIESGACYMCKGPVCNRCGKFGEGGFIPLSAGPKCEICGSPLVPGMVTCPNCGHPYAGNEAASMEIGEVSGAAGNEESEMQQ